jgi:hypothetical protein
MNVPFITFENQPIKLDREGVFWYGEQVVEHPRIARMLRIGLKRLAEGGYGYMMGPRSVSIEVEDAPFQVLSLHAEAAGLRLHLSDESDEILDPQSLLYRGDIPYCTLERGDPARFTRLAALNLGQLLDFLDGQVTLTVGGLTTTIPGAEV